MNGTSRVLMVVTSHDRFDDQHPTGLWLEEFAVPYLEFRQAGYDVTVASPKGGRAPVDPRSAPTPEQAAAWAEASRALESTTPLGQVNDSDYDAVFFPGGHGPMFDLPGNRMVGRIVSRLFESGRLVGAVCHGPAALVGVVASNGQPIVEGRRLTAFTNAEEREVQLTEAVPFLLQSKLEELGAKFTAAANWADHVERDGPLVTGQNPQSSASAARAVIDAIAPRAEGLRRTA